MKTKHELAAAIIKGTETEVTLIPGRRYEAERHEDSFEFMGETVIFERQEYHFTVLTKPERELPMHLKSKHWAFVRHDDCNRNHWLHLRNLTIQEL